MTTFPLYLLMDHASVFCPGASYFHTRHCPLLGISPIYQPYPSWKAISHLNRSESCLPSHLESHGLSATHDTLRKFPVSLAPVTTSSVSSPGDLWYCLQSLWNLLFLFKKKTQKPQRHKVLFIFNWRIITKLQANKKSCWFQCMAFMELSS